LLADLSKSKRTDLRRFRIVSASSIAPSVRGCRVFAEASVRVPMEFGIRALLEPMAEVSAGVGRGFLVHPAKITKALTIARHSFREIRFIEGT
jgi:hypothetical protein